MPFKRSTDAQITLTVYKTRNRKAAYPCDNIAAARRLAKRYSNDADCTKITASGGELNGTQMLYGAME